LFFFAIHVDSRSHTGLRGKKFSFSWLLSIIDRTKEKEPWLSGWPDWAKAYFGQFFITKVDPIFGATLYHGTIYALTSTKIPVVPLFGPFFHKLIRSPCLTSSSVRGPGGRL
jgi:hypothetical protein